MVFVSDEVNEDVKYICEKEWKDEIYDRSEKVVDNGIRYWIGIFVNWFDIFILLFYEWKECLYNVVRLNKCDNN